MGIPKIVNELLENVLKEPARAHGTQNAQQIVKKGPTHFLKEPKAAFGRPLCVLLVLSKTCVLTLL